MSRINQIYGLLCVSTAFANRDMFPNQGRDDDDDDDAAADDDDDDDDEEGDEQTGHLQLLPCATGI